jgi:amino acid adenylation domain-containing protein
MADARQRLEGLSADDKRRLLADLLKARAAGRHEFPLSPAQGRLWFFEQLTPGTSALFLPMTIHFTGPLDVPTLERALGEMVRRHETLRTAIGERHQEARQVVAAAEPVTVPVVDLGGWPAAAREAEVARVTRDTMTRAFDFARGPLWRATLVRTAPEVSRLLLVFHHLIADGLSVGLFVRDLAEFYDAAVTGRAPELPAVTTRYGDFAARQVADLQAGRFRDDLEYWRSALEGVPLMIDPPADYRRGPVRTLRADCVTWSVPAALAARVRAVARARGATAFMLMVSAFSVVLSRLTGVDDLVLGVPVAGRPTADVAPLVGLFINTLPLRLTPGGHPTVASLVDAARARVVDLQSHQAVPFDALVAELPRERLTTGSTPVFQVLFNMIDVADTRASRMGGVAVEAIADFDRSARFDLTLYVMPDGDGLMVTLLYAADRYAAARMTELLGQYRQTIERVLDDPDVAPTAIDLVTPAARRILPDPRAPLAAGPAGPSMVSRLREHARRTPTRIAVEDASGTLTWEQVDRRSDALAGRLRRAGVRVGDVVAIYAHRSRGLVVTMAAALKAGAAFCQLDAAQPAARLAACVAAATPVACVHMTAAGPMPEAVRAALAASARATLDLADDMGDEATGPATEAGGADAPDDPDRLAYVAFTSGTTGGVKAVAGTERPLRHFLAWHAATFNLTAADRFSMLSGLAHDPLLRDVLTPIWIGATLVVPDAEVLRNAAALAAWTDDRAVTVAHLTPQHARLIAAGAADGRLSRLRHVFFAGDVLTAPVLAAVRRVAPLAACVNFYGATETPQAMAYWVEPTAGDADGVLPPASIPVGRGIDGVQLLVVNPAGALAGVGELGEIWIRTPYLTRGYLNDPELTARRFVSNPFTGDPSDIVYRTGDLGRYRPDGQVEFAGRRDFQVKVRGFRVELQEVERVLGDHPAVADAVVVTRSGEDADTETSLVACVVPRPGQAPVADELRAHVAARLADYAVPARFELLERLPVLPGGKVDRAALRSPAGTVLRARAVVAPRTDLERRLREIWIEVLGTDDLGVHDSFFERGGHSLLATQVVARIRARLGADVPLRTLFDVPTIAGLAAAIDAPDARVPVAGAAGVDREEVEF